MSIIPEKSIGITPVYIDKKISDVSRSTVVANAQSLVGLKESDGSYKQIIDKYNSYTPLPQGYKVSYSDPWCAVTVSVIGMLSNASDIIPPECSCPRMITLLQNLGEWVEDDSHTPDAGDIIFYDWQDSGSGDNTGTADHVGIVEKVSGSTITVIEGNLNNAVGRRTITVNAQYIRGYGVQKYDGTDSGTTKSTTTTTTSTETEDYEVVKTYKNGSTSETVYADTKLQNKNGSLNPWESCDCLGKQDVEYIVDGTTTYKVGFVSYSGGLR